nr:hypothetical protein [uncultured bacterium]
MRRSVAQTPDVDSRLFKDDINSGRVSPVPQIHADRYVPKKTESPIPVIETQMMNVNWRSG